MEYMRRKKIILINRCNTDNFGDRIIGKCVSELFGEEMWKISKLDYAFVPPRFFEKCRFIRKIIDLIFGKLYKRYCIWKTKTADAVIIGGGELIAPGFYNSFIEWCNIISKSKTINKRYLFSVGVTDGFTSEQIKSINGYLSYFSSIYIRDYNSYDLFIKQFTYDNSRVFIMPDAVFSLKLKQVVNKQKVLLFGMTDRQRHNRHGVITFNTDDDLLLYYEKLLEEIIEERPELKIKLIYDSYLDKKIIKCFYHHIVKKNPDYKKRVEQQDITDEVFFMNLINESSDVVSPRMHACIVGMVSGAKVKPIIISAKMNTFYDLYFSSDQIKSISELREDVIKISKKIIDDIG